MKIKNPRQTGYTQIKYLIFKKIYTIFTEISAVILLLLSFRFIIDELHQRILVIRPYAILRQPEPDPNNGSYSHNRSQAKQDRNDKQPNSSSLIL